MTIRVTPYPWPAVARRSGLDEPAADRVAHELDAIAHPELGENVGAVAFDGLLADHQQLGDLPAGAGLGDQLDDLGLARRQRVLVDVLAAAHALEPVAHQRPDRTGV